jgi:hypothetical protein
MFFFGSVVNEEIYETLAISALLGAAVILALTQIYYFVISRMEKDTIMPGKEVGNETTAAAIVPPATIERTVSPDIKRIKQDEVNKTVVGCDPLESLAAFPNSVVVLPPIKPLLGDNPQERRIARRMKLDEVRTENILPMGKSRRRYHK